VNAGGVRPRPLRPMGKLLAEDTRRHHRSLILQHLFAEGPASRADLARATALTRVTVSDLVGGLIADGLLGELGSPAASKVGKPPTLVGLLGDAAHIVALDLSPADRMTGAVINLLGQVKARAEVRLDGASGEAAVRSVQTNSTLRWRRRRARSRAFLSPLKLRSTAITRPRSPMISAR